MGDQMPVKFREAKAIMIVSFLAAVIVFAACGGFNLYTPQDDVKLGQQLADQIESNPQEYPILRNQQAERYVEDILKTLVQSPEIKYRKVFKYQIKIIDNDKVINAFAAPGGFIYVYTGLLKFIDNEATLAGIIGHEIGHVENRHSTERMTTAYGAQLLTQAAMGENNDKTAEMAANLFTGLGLLKNSRDDEYEADATSFKLLRSTGKWYPGAIKLFFYKIAGSTSGGVGDSFKTLLSTHPLGPDRVEELDKLLKKNNIPPPKESNLGYRKYMEFKKKLN